MALETIFRKEEAYLELATAVNFTEETQHLQIFFFSSLIYFFVGNFDVFYAALFFIYIFFRVDLIPRQTGNLKHCRFLLLFLLLLVRPFV